MSRPAKGITRRGLGVTIAGSAVALAQQPAASPATTEDLNALAREQVKQASASLRKFEVPIATEPSFIFRP